MIQTSSYSHHKERTALAKQNWLFWDSGFSWFYLKEEFHNRRNSLKYFTLPVSSSFPFLITFPVLVTLKVSLFTASDKEIGILQDLKAFRNVFSHPHSPKSQTSVRLFSKILANTYMVHNDKAFLKWLNELILKLNKCNTGNGNSLYSSGLKRC